MAFVQNFPFFSIILTIFSGPLSTILDNKKVKIWNMLLIGIVCALNLAVLGYVISTGESYTYMMGHFPAPWGNEIRVGVLEAFMAVFFCVVMFFCVISGGQERAREIESSKQNLFYVMVNLLLCSLIALVYTNDIFTAYVFVEINTLSACGLIMIKNKLHEGRTLEASVRYMIMSLLGSGMLLLGICFLYGLTGHLLMSNMQEAITNLVATGQYQIPLLVSICLMSVGLAIKSALFPFHSWVPDAYGYSTLSSASILSSLVSKGYIFLLIKIFFRVIGFEVIIGSHVLNVLFIFGVIGMIVGSLDAIQESGIRRMIAYSSVAQIGYIYMGLGLGTTAGVVASVYHILSHAATKALLFVSAYGLTNVSSNRRNFKQLTGSGYRNKLAGVAFSVGALSMVGFPLLCGFESKVLFAQAAVETHTKMFFTLFALAISTILNTVYFMKTVIRIYTPMDAEEEKENEFTHITAKEDIGKSIAMICLVVMNFALGIFSQPIIELIETGLAMFM